MSSTRRASGSSPRRPRGLPPEEIERRAEDPSRYDTFFVPPVARWSHPRNELHGDVREGLNKVLGALEQDNVALDGVLDHIDFNRKVGQSRIPDRRLCELILHCSTYRLRNDDFEFPDLLGACAGYRPQGKESEKR